MKIIKFNLEELEKDNTGFAYYILGRCYDLEENDVLMNNNKVLKYY